MYSLANYALKIKGLANPAIIPTAVLRIDDLRHLRRPEDRQIGSATIKVTREVTVRVAIYETPDAPGDGSPVIEERLVTFADWPAASSDELASYNERNPASAILQGSTMWTQFFGSPFQVPEGLTSPDTGDSASVMAAYIALPQHPDLAALLTGATKI